MQWDGMKSKRDEMEVNEMKWNEMKWNEMKWMNEWMNEGMNEWMNEQIICIHSSVNEKIGSVVEQV